MTKEELQILRDMMREEIGTALQKGIGVALQPMNERLEKLEAGQKKLEAGQEKLEAENRYTRILLEKQEHNIALIAEQYGDIALKLERVREIDDLRDRVRTLETIVRSHSAKLRELDKAE